MLTDVIDRIGHISDIVNFSESYEDERCRVDLLYKKDSRIDVLISPDGFRLEDMNYKIYLRFEDQKCSRYEIFQDAAVSRHITRNGRNYLVLEELLDDTEPPERRRFVLPFQSSGPNPFRIMPNSFTKSLEEALDAEFEIDNLPYGSPLSDMASNIYDTFADIPESQFAPLKKFSRNAEHIPLLSIRYRVLIEGKELFSYIKKNIALMPLKIVAGTISEQKRNLIISGEKLYEIDIGTGEKDMDLLKKYEDSARSINIELGNSLEHLYRACVELAPILSFGANVFFDVPFAYTYAIIGWAMLENLVSRRNYKRCGCDGNLIGTIREKLHLEMDPKKYLS